MFKIIRLSFKLLRLPFKLIRFFSVGVLITAYTLCCSNNLAYAQNEEETVINHTYTLDISKAQNVSFANFSETEHLCSVTFNYYCDDLNYSIILYIEDTTTKNLYYTSSFVIDPDIVDNCMFYQKIFSLPNGTYNLYVGFTGMPLDEEGMLTYLPTGRLYIHNNETTSVDAIVTKDIDFYYRAKNIILLDPKYQSIVDNTLSNVLHAEQEGRPYTSQQIYNYGIATQYNNYKDNKYEPKESEYFYDISVITPTRCEIDPSADVYIQYYENLTNPAAIESISKEMAEQRTTTSDHTNPENNSEESTTVSGNNNPEGGSNNNEQNTTLNEKESESKTLKPFETFSTVQETESNDDVLSNKKYQRKTIFTFICGIVLVIVGGITLFINVRCKKDKNNNIEL